MSLASRTQWFDAVRILISRKRILMTGLKRRTFREMLKMLNDPFALVVDMRQPVEVMFDH